MDVVYNNIYAIDVDHQACIQQNPSNHHHILQAQPWHASTIAGLATRSPALLTPFQQQLAKSPNAWKDCARAFAIGAASHPLHVDSCTSAAQSVTASAGLSSSLALVTLSPVRSARERTGHRSAKARQPRLGHIVEQTMPLKRHALLQLHWTKTATCWIQVHQSIMTWIQIMKTIMMMF
jgi:hypothetical protein